MLIGGNIYNAGQFGYHIFSARLLGNVYYGDLAALLNILGIFALFQASLGMTIVKFVASEKDEKKAKSLVKWSLKIGIYLGLVMAVLLLLLSPYINSFLKLSEPRAIYFLAPIALIYAITSVSRSALQGLLRFFDYVVTLISEIGVKFLVTVVLVLAGYSILGAMTGLLLGVVASVLIGLWSIRSSFNASAYTPEIKPMLSYVLPAFLQGVALTSMYSTDLFLVKHFFTPETAGTYAAVVKLGSIVFFVASPISNVMFPLVVKKHAHGEKYHNIFYSSIALITLASVVIIGLYYLYPTVFLSALGQGFLVGSPILWISGLYMGLLALNSLIIQFYMSIAKTFTVWLFVSAAVLQTILIYLFHNDLAQVLFMSVISSSLLLAILLLYYPYHDRKR